MSIHLKKAYDFGVRNLRRPGFATKVCKVCGDAIRYTRRAARDWEQIQYCSAVCRRIGVAQERKRASAITLVELAR